MALDVYVGSLTRYYAGDWESVGDRTSRERGRQTESGQPRACRRAKKDRERIQASVLAWRRGARAGARTASCRAIRWNETSESPWFTDRPGWDGFGSLVLWAAYAEQPALRRPAALPRGMGRRPRAGAQQRRRLSLALLPPRAQCRALAADRLRLHLRGRGCRRPAHHRRLLDDARAASSASSTPRPGRWMTTR